MLKTYLKLVGVFLLYILFLGQSVPIIEANGSNHYYQKNTQTPTDPVEFKEFLDDFFASKMEELGIPGVAFVMVKEDQLFFSKGYGFADLEKQLPIDPAQTVFRVGSVSKLLTATAVMQLVGEGDLDVNGDINQYLTVVQIPDSYDQAITPAHLLTHTGGFEDRVMSTITFEPADLLPLGEFLANYSVVERVNPPGAIHRYSNHSYSLLGQMVAEVSGKSFIQYTDDHIFTPLEMTSTTFAQPLPDNLASRLAVGYYKNQDGFEAGDFIHLHIAPAGSLSTTAEDISHFIMAMLQDGRYKNTQILDEATIQQMQAQQFTHHPDLPGMAFGFKERFVNNQRLIGHNGDIGTYSSQLILLPEHEVGFFMVYNVFNDALREQFITAFMDRYFPLQTPPPAPSLLTPSADELARFTGEYRWVRYPHSTLAKLSVFIPGANSWTIFANDDNTLTLAPFGSADGWRYAQVEPLVFKQVSGEPLLLGGIFMDPGETLAFREDANGEIALSFIGFQNVAFEKLAWYENSGLQMGLAGFIVLVFLSAGIYPLMALRKRNHQPTTGTNPTSQRARWLSVVVALVNIVATIAVVANANDSLGVGPSMILKIALGMLVLTSLITLGLVGFTVIAWKDKYWTVGERIHYTVITLSAVLFVWWLNYWNLLGWRF